MTNIYEVSNNSGDDGVYLAQNASVTYDISSLSGQMFFKGAVSNSSEYGASHEMEIKNICFTNSSS